MMTDFTKEFKELEKFRDEHFAIKLVEDVACGMNVTEIKITTNGHQWQSISLKNNEIKRLVDILTPHIKHYK